MSRCGGGLYPRFAPANAHTRACTATERSAVGANQRRVGPSGPVGAGGRRKEEDRGARRVGVGFARGAVVRGGGSGASPAACRSEAQHPSLPRRARRPLQRGAEAAHARAVCVRGGREGTWEGGRWRWAHGKRVADSSHEISFERMRTFLRPHFFPLTLYWNARHTVVRSDVEPFHARQSAAHSSSVGPFSKPRRVARSPRNPISLRPGAINPHSGESSAAERPASASDSTAHSAARAGSL